VKDWRPLEAYAKADKIYQHLKSLSTSEAMETVNLNRDEMESEHMQFIWDIVECKVNARDKARLPQ
jgi:hypothetical protein